MTHQESRKKCLAHLTPSDVLLRPSSDVSTGNTGWKIPVVVMRPFPPLALSALPPPVPAHWLHSAHRPLVEINSDPPNPLCPLFTGAESRPAIGIPTTAHLQLGQVMDETLTRGTHFWCPAPPALTMKDKALEKQSLGMERAQPCRKWTAPPVVQECLP